MKLITKIKSLIKKTAIFMIYASAIATFSYGIYFCIKHRGNGNNVLVNFLIGSVDGIVRSVSFISEKWIDYRNQ